jgi:[ribosomal protein S5]-alanine N-acetyltransferase
MSDSGMSDSVTLRPLEPADWPAVHAWARLPEFSRFQPWGPNTEQDTRAFVAEAVDAWSQDPQTRYTYLASLEGEPIGHCEIVVRERRFRRGAISYGVRPESWGRGHGTAIGRELLRIGFDELSLHRIEATCDPRNAGSAGVLRKLGMTYEGRQRHTMLVRDGWRDSEMFSVLDDEWRTR